jgi:ABC-type polysaccharide/polyol phosphate transport system ATPase subunit
MTDPFIKVENVFKKYSRNAQNHLIYGLGDFLREVSGRRQPGLRRDEFFAVNDVSFGLSAGDSFALVGRNGSGKTTLLKMLNGMIKPDGGRITMAGRVQALINLGAGFSQRLSGLENIYNSASLMGLSRQETRDLADAIIDFSELEDFIESPVGTYSSGMKARLGFSVAVHLKPDILLIDEILAVGDAAFQNKCYTRMEQLKHNGVTIVFVSHSEGQIIKLCQRALWIHNGKTIQTGKARDIVQAYLRFLEKEEAEKAVRSESMNHTGKQKEREEKAEENQQNNGSAKNTIYGPVYDAMDSVDEISCELFVDGEPVQVIPIHSEVLIRFSFRLKTRAHKLYSTLNFHRQDGLRIASIASMTDDRFKDIHEGRVTCEVRIPDFDFSPGSYLIMMPIADGQRYLWRDIVKEFAVVGEHGPYFGIKDISHTCSVKAE